MLRAALRSRSHVSAVAFGAEAAGLASPIGKRSNEAHPVDAEVWHFRPSLVLLHSAVRGRLAPREYYAGPRIRADGSVGSFSRARIDVHVFRNEPSRPAQIADRSSETRLVCDHRRQQTRPTSAVSTEGRMSERSASTLVPTICIARRTALGVRRRGLAPRVGAGRVATNDSVFRARFGTARHEYGDEVRSWGTRDVPRGEDSGHAGFQRRIGQNRSSRQMPGSRSTSAA